MLLDDDDDWVTRLPPHRRCSAHLLNLILATNVDGITDAEYVQIRDTVFKKLNIFWKWQKSYSVIYKRYWKKKIPQPMKVRWHTYVDAIEEIVKAGISVVNKIGTEIAAASKTRKTMCNADRFNSEDFLFLEEYLQVVLLFIEV